MEFTDRIISLIDKRGITKNKLLVDLKLSKNSFVNWQERGTIPSGETLSKIAAYFNVTTDYLLGNEQKNKPSAEAESLSDIENEILRIYHSLPEDKKQAFMTVARSLKSQSKDK